MSTPKDCRYHLPRPFPLPTGFARLRDELVATEKATLHGSSSRRILATPVPMASAAPVPALKADSSTTPRRRTDGQDHACFPPSETTPSRPPATIDSVPEGIPARRGPTPALPFAPKYLGPPTTPSASRHLGTPNLASGEPTEPLQPNRLPLGAKRAGTLPVRLSRVYGIAALGTPGQNRVRRKDPRANLPVIQS